MSRHFLTILALSFIFPVAIGSAGKLKLTQPEIEQVHRYLAPTYLSDQRKTELKLQVKKNFRSVLKIASNEVRRKRSKRRLKDEIHWPSDKAALSRLINEYETGIDKKSNSNNIKVGTKKKYAK